MCTGKMLREGHPGREGGWDGTAEQGRAVSGRLPLGLRFERHPQCITIRLRKKRDIGEHVILGSVKGRTDLPH